MTLGILLFLVWTALEVLFIAATIRWGFETGQWKDIEEPKYRVLVDHELQGWPGRDKPKTEKPAGQAVKR